MATPITGDALPDSTVVNDPLGHCPACGVINGAHHVPGCTLFERTTRLAKALDEERREAERREGARRADEAYNHPAHYGGADNPYETIKVLANWLTDEQMTGFCIGNAIKYVSRAGKKDPTKALEDLKKAQWYLDYEATRKDTLSSLRAHDIGG